MSEIATSRDAGVVAIEIPATNRHIALARTTAVGVVADLNPDLDAVENIRLAVNELVSLVLESASGGRVRVEFRLDPPTLTVTARPSQPGTPPVVDELARRILETTATRYDFLDDGSAELRIEIDGASYGE